MSGSEVLQLQKRLSELGYYQGALDGIFGPGTYNAVYNFQVANNLSADGIAGPVTLGALNLLGTTGSTDGTPGATGGTQGATTGDPAVLKQGMSGDSVLKLQQQLHNLGYYQGAIDGSFGALTRSAVLSFQYDNNLTVDGIVGQETMMALQTAKPKADLANRGQAVDRNSLAIAEFAKQYLGVPYVWAGQGPSGFDCSGFVYYVYSNFGIKVPRMADEQYYSGEVVSKLQPGDLVFFTTYEPGPSHVGIYIGNNNFIHASSAAGEVTITSLSAPYYSSRYLGARRYSI